MDRTNWVHHVDYYDDGSIGIDRRGSETPRVYIPTQASLRRLERATLLWTHFAPRMWIDPKHLRNRAMAPMRRY
jgi:hypothetical protein